MRWHGLPIDRELLSSNTAIDAMFVVAILSVDIMLLIVVTVDVKLLVY